MFNLNNAKPEKLDIEEQKYLIEQDELDIKRQNI